MKKTIKIFGIIALIYGLVVAIAAWVIMGTCTLDTCQMLCMADWYGGATFGAPVGWICFRHPESVIDWLSK